MTAQKYLIGIDTGGTYTDAAVIAETDHRVIASAKALTTKGDLAIGVSQAIREAMTALPKGVAPRDISLVSVSTTLATNAVVEGHGSAVGAVLIGFDADMAARTGIAKAFPGMPVALIAGGHDHNGDERTSLNEESLRTWLAAHGNGVDSFAVAASFAIRNPMHEHRAREILGAAGKPVTISTELSSALDAPRRALTSVLNARLIARISALIAAVERAMKEIGIVCPLMIVKGDGTLALAETVAVRPIETVLSGPAASLVGARWLSGLSDFVMSDMGGTTTDLGVLLDGRPKITEEGAEVGGWRTMVKAADIRTIGLGGDSEVKIAMDGALSIGPQRVVPVSLLGARFPETIEMLAGDLADNEGGSLQGKFVLRPFGATGGPNGQFTQREQEILALVTERPKPLRKVALSSGTQRALASLARRSVVQLAGFTPSDAAHVLDLQNNWSREAAQLAAQLTARFRDMKAPTPERVEAFAREVWSETVRLSGRAILGTTLGTSNGGDALLDAVCSGAGHIGLTRIAIAPSVPVVAVGGPVKVYYPEVGRRLGCEIVFSPFCDVANAVGAAVGAVARSVIVTIDGDGAGAFRVHGPLGTEAFDNGREALAHATKLARKCAREDAARFGAIDIEVRVRTEKHLLPDAVDDNGIFRAAVTAEAVGRPRH
jgi:N-methylhydantoinase A/oxoprolinase/acetone carboxylase beta subunit